MNKVTAFALAGVTVIAIAGTVTACGHSDDRVQVVQYGYYGVNHTWYPYSTAHIVYVTPAQYKSDSKMYSKPSEVTTYTKTHTVVRESKTTVYNNDGIPKSPTISTSKDSGSTNKPSGSTSKPSSSGSTSKTTTSKTTTTTTKTTRSR